MCVVRSNPARNRRLPLAGLLLGFTLVTPLAFRLLPAAAATFTVTTTADVGPGSLRAAIEAANAAPGADTILFRIPTTDPGFGGGVFTIRPTSELPAIQGPTFLDGFSQTGFTGNTNPNGPEIVLNGPLAGNANGLVVRGANSVVRDLVVNGFAGDGILIDGPGATGNRVEGCYVGTNPAGTAAVPNSRNGVEVFDRADNNRIGGTTERTRNVLSGNGEAGLQIFEGDANVVLGNYLGTNAAGTAAVPNQSVGLAVLGAQDIRIGGTEPGSRNLVSGNRLSGITLEETHQSQIQGNYIGTDVRGETALPNGQAGVETVQVSEILIGGSASAARNVISGNQGNGIVLAHVARNCRVQGNFIGVNGAGTAAIPNRLNGVALFEGVENVIGGTTASLRNILSGNGANGIALLTASASNQIQGNYIGTNPVGRVSIPNGAAGILIADGTQATQVGGTTTGARNLISGNTEDGIRISGESVTDPSGPASAFNVIQGNFIGTDVSGDRTLPNGLHGVELQGTPDNTIGGTTPGARNLISGNTRHGISLEGEGSQRNVIAGNHIGTNLAGTVALPNRNNGIYFSFEVENNLIGGTTTDARNLISGNLSTGVFLEFSGPLNRLEGNYIGTNANGSGALPNGFGVSLFGVSGLTEIGGEVPGARNLISGNQGGGISLEDSSGVRIRGNYIGTNALGTTALPNDGDGIGTGNTGGHQIGGLTAAERNVISGNRGDGINLSHLTSFVLVQGNYVGVNAAGTGAVPNSGYGVQVFEGTLNTLGGTSVGSRNVISGNVRGGVLIAETSDENVVEGNYIGSNAAGTQALANSGHGLEIRDSRRNRVGGPAAGAGNVISGNAQNGIFMTGWEFAPADENEIQGNLIGLNALGTGALPNRAHGVELMGATVHENPIGGTAAGAGNRIAFNFGDGVLLRAFRLEDNMLVGNPIRANAIYENRGLGINLQPFGEPPSTVTPNDFQDPDPGPNRLQNFPVLTEVVLQPGMTTLTGTLNSTPSSPFALDFFRSPTPDPSGFGEGQQYLGSISVNTDVSGNASFTFVATGTGAGEGGFFTATATNTSTLDTGEFSAALQGSSMSLAAGNFAAGARGAGVGQITGQVTDASGRGVTEVRLSLHQLTSGELYSRDWDPERLQVTHPDETGAFRFAGLPRGRYLVLAYAPGVYFTPRAGWVEVGTSGSTHVSFTVAGTDQAPPTATIAVPVAGDQDSSPQLVEGTVADPGGAGGRAVLVRLSLLDPEPGQPERWLDWQTGTWNLQAAPNQTRRATLNDAGNGWKLDLPTLAPGHYRLEVQAYDWAGYASQPVTTDFRIR